VIAGNPRVNRTGLMIAVLLLLALLATVLVVTMRKRNAPQNEPPLVPSLTLTSMQT